jgi:hypothetical protein
MRTPPALRRLAALLLVAGLALPLLAGCGGDDTQPAADADAAGDAVEPALTITRGERSPALPGATARFSAPGDGQVVEAQPVEVTVDVTDFETEVQTETPRRAELANSGRGQHVHIIVDNDPYYANYTPGAPFEVGELEPGPHSAIVFPSRSYHESVKNEGAMDYVNFYVGGERFVVDDAAPFPFDPEQPTIIYSRPKGTYSGAGAEKVLLDFYLHNVQLSEDGYKARYTIMKDDEAGTELGGITLTEWVPAFVEGFTPGTYVVRLELLDADGNVVDGMFNTTNRTITVEGDGGEA